ncbi:unnamed protein product [Medioppia subpectinata]|uniref:Aminoacyl-tRNA synthetase class II (G/ P/ S/T) domain-containing protein n=1 Tax=Medioppia subpectinata TaxID=1979941 RepID=A0A7R9KAK7_9ACAR|nr:unnamed protein product [Medioppia subpectinata]CAG2099934.1 unnamed protein product [Medioppia subpectinata]
MQNEVEVILLERNSTPEETIEEIISQFENLHIKDRQLRLKERIDELDGEIMSLLPTVGNILDSSVPIHKTDDATSEQPLTALFMNKRLTDFDLPKIYAGESLCFRKEAGAYGKDNAGIFRPSESEMYHDQMLNISREFYESLDLSYQVVLISSGEMNDAASKKYDLEAFFPNAGKYRELVSASNCTDYQSRNLNVYYGFTKANEKPQFVHMLNSTLCAIQRTLCCIVENYQDGLKIIVPEVLRKYVTFDYIE